MTRLRRRTDTLPVAVLSPEELVDRLAAARELGAHAADVARTVGPAEALAATTRAVLALVGARCGRVWTWVDGGLVPGPGAPCDDGTGCPACDPARTVLHRLGNLHAPLLLDRADDEGSAVLLDAPHDVMSVLAIPVPVPGTTPTTVVVRSDEPGQLDQLAAELAGLVTANAAVGLTTLATRSAQDDGAADLVAVLTHDLRSPLASVGRAVELVRDRAEELDVQQQAQLLEGASRQIARLQRLIADVSLAVADDVDIVVSCVPVEVGALVDDEVARHAGTEQSALLVTLGSIGVRALADRDRTLQVLQNLVDNAFAHGTDGEPVIISTHGDHAVVHIDVVNHGDGIPSSERQSVFDRFRRGTGAAGRGAGLGLFIARRYARAMGGDVTLVDAGPTTVFRLTLPRPGTGRRRDLLMDHSRLDSWS